MKINIKIFTKPSFYGLPLFILVLGMLFCTSCKDDGDGYDTNELGIKGESVLVEQDSGFVEVQVYSNGKWTAFGEEGLNWISIPNPENFGDAKLKIEFERNTGFARLGKIFVHGKSKTDTLIVKQNGITPFMEFDKQNYVAEGSGGEVKIEMHTNIPQKDMEITLTYLAEEHKDWISDIKIEDGYLIFTAAKNSSDKIIKKAVLDFKFEDAFQQTYSAQVMVRQATSKGLLAETVNFEYVRALAADIQEGEITIDKEICIDAIVISDKGNHNMGQNINKTNNLLDKTENAITSYIQSLDGKYGFRIRSNNIQDNVYSRYDKVTILLEGVKLKKEMSPERYTLNEVTATVIFLQESGSADDLTVKTMSIDELKDSDIYTYVTLKDIEVSVPNGSLANINEGYVSRTDCYPLSMRDIKGNDLYVLTNFAVPYRKPGTIIQQGSGTVSGIVVHEKHPRYGGNIGQYSLRHVSADDFKLEQERENGFSNILAEWTKFRTENLSNPTPEKNPLTPDIGADAGAKLTHSKVTIFENTYTKKDRITKWYGYNNYKANTLNDDGWACTEWWINGQPKSWNIEVSTQGISSPISMQLEGCSFVGAPRNWIVEWSADNSQWNALKEFTFEDLVVYANTLQTQVPGFKVINFRFPQEASGLEKLYIKIRPTSNKAGTSTSDTGGTVTNSNVAALGHISIKYNK